MTKILLLDDSVIIQKVVRVALGEMPGFDLTVARQLSEVTGALKQGLPGVVMAYVRLPGGNNTQGFVSLRNDLTNRAEQQGIPAPFWVLVAESNEDVSAFEEAGFSTFLRKPFTTSQLHDVLSQLPEAARDEQSNDAPALSQFDEEDDAPTQAVLMASLNASTPVGKAPSARVLPPPPAPPENLRNTISAVNHQHDHVAPALSLHPYTQPSPTTGRPWENQSAVSLGNKGYLPPKETRDLEAIPELTIDLDALEQGFKSTISQQNPPVFLSTPPPPAPRVTAVPFEFELSADPENAPEIEERKTNHHQEQEQQRLPAHSRKRAEAGSPSEGFVPVAVRAAAEKEEREEMKRFIQGEIDDAMMKVLQRAVPAKIDATIDLKWDQLVQQVTERMTFSVTDGVLHEVKSFVTGELRKECRNLMTPWLENQALELARSLVSAELKDLLRDVS